MMQGTGTARCDDTFYHDFILTAENTATAPTAAVHTSHRMRLDMFASSAGSIHTTDSSSTAMMIDMIAFIVLFLNV